ncbi:MAG: hypothetical protein ACJATX_000165, partial [Candidatus Paceibacteria bacterium]
MKSHAFNKEYRQFLKLKKELGGLGVNLRGTLGKGSTAKSIKHGFRAQMRTIKSKLKGVSNPIFKNRYKKLKKNSARK